TIAPQQSEILFDALARHGNDVTLALIHGLGHGFFNRTTLDDRGARQIRIETASGGTRSSAQIEAPVFSLVEAFFKRVLGHVWEDPEVTDLKNGATEPTT